MKIFIIILLLICGLLLCLILYPVIKKKNNLVKNTKLTTIAYLIKKFEQMTMLNKGDTYTEYVTLAGKIQNRDLSITPFSKKNVAYFEASASILTERKEKVKDSTGYDQTKIIRTEKTIYSESTGDKLELIDKTTSESVILEINCGGCNIDIPEFMSKEVSKEEFDLYNTDIVIPNDLAGDDILGYKIKEKILENGSNVYVVGEARKSGGKIHICLSRDLKKPFIVTTKPIENYIKQKKDNSWIILIIGIVLVLLGIMLIFV